MSAWPKEISLSDHGVAHEDFLMYLLFLKSASTHCNKRLQFFLESFQWLNNDPLPFIKNTISHLLTEPALSRSKCTYPLSQFFSSQVPVRILCMFAGPGLILPRNMAASKP